MLNLYSPAVAGGAMAGYVEPLGTARISIEVRDEVDLIARAQMTLACKVIRNN